MSTSYQIQCTDCETDFEITVKESAWYALDELEPRVCPICGSDSIEIEED